MSDERKPELFVVYRCTAERCDGAAVLDAYKGPPKCSGALGTSTQHPPAYMRPVALLTETSDG